MIVNREALVRELELVTLATNEKSTVPVVQSVLLVAEGGSLGIMATDMDTHLQSTVALEAEAQDFGTMLPGKRLLSLLRSLSGDTVEFMAQANQRVAIRCSGHKSELPGLSRHEFPVMRPEEPEAAASIPPGHLLSILRDGGFCADDKKPPHGFEMKLAGGRLTVCSTDHSNAALSSLLIEDANPSVTLSAIIGTFATPKVEALVKSAKEIHVGIAPSQVHLRDEAGRVLKCRRIDANVPDVQGLLDRVRAFQVSVLIDREEALLVTKRLAGFVDATPFDELDIEIGEELVFRAGDPDHGRAVEVLGLAKEMNGKSRFIAKFSRFVEALRRVRTEFALLRVTEDPKGRPFGLFNNDPGGVYGEWGFLSGTIHRKQP